MQVMSVEAPPGFARAGESVVKLLDPPVLPRIRKNACYSLRCRLVTWRIRYRECAKGGSKKNQARLMRA